MFKTLFAGLLMLTTMQATALTTQSFRDNTDIALSLSDSNYNRLVVRGDKITQAHFPEGALGIKNEEDGSLYVMLASTTPFTLFLTTESGHHFSATVSAEPTLGKTIEFVPQQPARAPVRQVAADQITPQAPPYANAISTLMTNMIANKQQGGFDIKHHYGRVTRLQQGLVLTPKLTYAGLELNGEVMELYNGGKQPLDIQEAWFADENVKAVSVSAATLAPKQKATVYRILESKHG